MTQDRDSELILELIEALRDEMADLRESIEALLDLTAAVGAGRSEEDA